MYIYAVNKKWVSFMQKIRRLMGSNGVSFQMFLIQLSFTETALGSESQVSVDQVTL